MEVKAKKLLVEFRRKTRSVFAFRKLKVFNHKHTDRPVDNLIELLSPGLRGIHGNLRGSLFSALFSFWNSDMINNFLYADSINSKK